MSRPVHPFYVLIGAEVRVAREAAELSQQQLAAAVGVTRTSITNLEAGRQQTPLHVLYAIADACGVPLKTLLPDHAERQLVPHAKYGEEDKDRWAAMVTSRSRRTA